MRKPDSSEVMAMFMGQAFCIVLAAMSGKIPEETRHENVVEQVQNLFKLGDEYFDEYESRMTVAVDLYHKILVSLLEDGPNHLILPPVFSKMSTDQIDDILGMGD